MTDRHAYMIIAHNAPEQLKLLLNMLDYPGNDIFIHIDKKSSMTKSEVESFELKFSTLSVYKEIPVYWSHYSLVEAELYLLKKAIAYSDATGIEYSYLHLISGVDLPIKTQGEIHKFFQENNGKEFVEYQVPGKFLSKPYYSRTKYYHVLSKYYRINGIAGKILSYTAIACEYICMFIQMLVRVNRIDKNMSFARGSNWFSITPDLARFIISKEDWIRKKYVMTRAGDESFVQMLVHNSDFRDRLYLKTFDGDMHANMRYIDWHRGDPYTFVSSDFNDLMKSDLLFARKFDITKDPEITMRIHSVIMAQQNKELETF